MAKKTLRGLQKIEFAPIAADGGVGTAWVQLPATEKGTVTITETDSTTQEFFINEVDTAYESVITDIGTVELNGSTFEITKETLALLKGGTFDSVSNSWSPNDVVDLETSVRLTSRNGFVLTITRMRLNGRLDINFSTDNLGRITMSGRMLAPEKAGEPRYTITLPSQG